VIMGDGWWAVSKRGEQWVSRTEEEVESVDAPFFAGLDLPRRSARPARAAEL